MKKIAAFVLLAAFFLAPGLARAESEKELTENPNSFDGRQVMFQGEVIGVMMRGDHAWVNILDNGYAIGVWCRADDAMKVSFVGDYNNLGDKVEVVGIFHMACLEHGGDMDVHAESFEISSRGHVIERMPSFTIILVSFALAVVAIFVFLYLRRVRTERKKLLPWPSY